MPAPTLIIGLGNPILGDDGVGWAVVDQVKQRLGLSGAGGSSFDPEPLTDAGRRLEFDRLSLGGLSLMERMLGYSQVILVDSILTGRAAPGHVWQFDLSDLADPSGGHTTAAHDTSLPNAIRVGRAMGAQLPELDQIHVVAIEAEQVLDFSETLSPPIREAVPAAVEAVLDRLGAGPHDE